MRRITLIVSLLLGVNFLFAQPVVTWGSLKKDKARSDKAIENPKKSAKVKTWVNRASLYYDIYAFNTTGLYKGLPAKEGVMNAENIVGKPDKILTKGDEEIWVYPRKKLTFINGALDSWEETDYIDKDALMKSVGALLKAEEIDAEGKFKKKKSVMDNSKNIRTALINEGIAKYEKNDFNSAYELMSKSIVLSKFPKSATDTAFKIYAVHYYSGIIAFKGKMFDNAEKHFTECVNANYEAGTSYHYIADCYAQRGDSTGYINKVKEGFTKVPNSEQLIIDLINFYISKNEPDKVIEYIDIAINKNPDNPSYYSAKATIYDNRKDDAFDKYKVFCDEIYEHKKAAFRDRFDAKKKSEHEKNMEASQAKADEQMAILKKAFDKSDELYKLSLEKDPKFFNAAFNLGRLYYKKYEDERWISDWIFKVYKMSKVADSDKYKAESKKSLAASADFFEQAHKANSTDRTTIELLRSIYYKLRNKEKEEIYRVKLENLGQVDESGIK